MNKRQLSSLLIQNYRSLENLQIEQLGQINLIVGPNNIGKSSLLEAILLWGTKRHFMTIRDILRSRNECHVEFPDRFQLSPFLGLHHLFTGFPDLSSKTEPLLISTADKKDVVDLHIYDAKLDSNNLVDGPLLAFNIAGAGSDQVTPFMLGGKLSGPSGDVMEFKHYLDNKCLYLSPSISDAAKVPLSELWEQCEVSRRETEVIESLQLIDRGIEKVFFIGSNRIAVCRIQGREHPVPLNNLGDGVSRLFELILGIVNVADGICLIDEFENGLHWSVQEKVWDVVFQTAKKLNVQIFATTHSQDTLKAFQMVALRQDSETFAGIIQMKRRNEQTVAQTIFGDDIRKILQYAVEVR